MKKIITVLFILSTIIFGQNAWINEFHYDNDGADQGEFIEVAIENINNYILSDFVIDLYRAEDGTSYGSHNLGTFTKGTTNNDITLYYKNISGIQNGPDGFSLEYSGNMIQFLSYEGSFSATAGVAIGQISIDIGVSENSSTSSGESLQLNGTGTQYSDFIWVSPAVESKGIPNNFQILPVELTTFSVLVLGKDVVLNWETATEVNNYGFNIERKSEFSDWSKVGFVEGSGNSNSPKNYTFVDNLVLNSGKYFYRLKQVDIDGTFEYSSIVKVDISTQIEFNLSQNFPNPFNPSTSIQFSLPEKSQVKLIVFNVIGEKVEVLVNKNLEAGHHNVEFDASELNSGIYIYKLEANGFVQMNKMMLIK